MTELSMYNYNALYALWKAVIDYEDLLYVLKEEI